MGARTRQQLAFSRKISSASTMIALAIAICLLCLDAASKLRGQSALVMGQMSADQGEYLALLLLRNRACSVVPVVVFVADGRVDSCH